MSAVNVESRLGIVPNLVNTGEVTQEKGLMSAMNVGNILCENLLSVNIREFTLEKGLRCAGNVQFFVPCNHQRKLFEELSV